MPFAYYARLSRAQQTIYRKSDAITEIRLERPADLHPLVTALTVALESEKRAATQIATERLVQGLTDALGIPSVRVEVLAARPHARWGELHGLYTADRRGPPQIQLWMRTAKQRRVVAFRTFLRTLLHEVGHHIDYTFLDLKDSFHTEGFYKRESSLFHQLVSSEQNVEASEIFSIDGVGGARTRNVESYARHPREKRLELLARVPTEVARLLRGHTEATLSRRPAPDAWSAGEIVCHLRDAEEHLAGWIETTLLNEEPPLLVISTADRWADERQYQRQHVGTAWNAFSRRRDETLALLGALAPAQWNRGGVQARRGRMTVDDLVSLIASHDDNHLDQLKRALEGRV